MHGDFGILEPQDVLLAMSYSGASDEVIALLPPSSVARSLLLALPLNRRAH